MSGSTERHTSIRVAVRVLRTLGYLSIRALQLLFATIASMSDKANAPLLPPDTRPLPRPEDYRP